MNSEPHVPTAKSPGQEPDFEAFYCGARRIVMDTARRMSGSQHIAEDATSAAFVEICRKWDIRRSESFAVNLSYARGIAVRKVADHFRHWRRSRPYAGYIELPAQVDEEREPQPEYYTVLQQIDRQPYRRRAVIVLHFLEGLEYGEIADILDMSVSTVRTHIQRARTDLLPYAQRLRRAMRDGGEL